MAFRLNVWYQSPPNTYYGGKKYENLPDHIRPPLKSARIEDICDWLLELDLINWFATYWLRLPITNEKVKEVIQSTWEILLYKPPELWEYLYEQSDWAVSGYIVGIIIHLDYWNYCIWLEKSKVWELKDPEWWNEYVQEH